MIDGVTVTVPAFVPLAGDTLIQVALSDAVQSSEPPPVFETASVLAAGLAPPWVAENDRRAGRPTARAASADRASSVTVTVFGEPVAPGAVSVTSSV